MPRAVSPWTWRRALRDHGPRSPSVLLTLYTIGTFMDRDGIAWPSQPKIAAGARTSVRTVRRHITAAQRMGWLGVELAGRGGRGWRHNAYRSAVPDGLDLDDLDESISDALISQVGDIAEREDTIVSPPRVNGEDTAMSSPSVRNDQREDIRDTNVRTFGAEGEDTGRQNVRTQLCPTNSRSETPAYRTHTSEEAHNAQSRVASAPNVSLNGGREPEVQRQKTGITDEQLWQTVNVIGPDHEYRVSVMTKILAAKFLDVTEDRLWRVIRAEQAKLSQRQQIP